MICQSLELACAQTASLVAEAKHVSHDAVLVSICSLSMRLLLSVYRYGEVRVAGMGKGIEVGEKDELSENYI